jgi:hypothetical protein
LHGLRTLAAVATVWMVAAMVIAPSARADGDPASDVLSDQAAFIPAGRGIPPGDQSRLEGVIRSAAHHGLAVRVALIAARSDLGAITELWRQPAQYARFLGTELANVFSGTLIVVMPNGYGVWIDERRASRTALRRAGSSLIGAPLPGSGQRTAAAAVGAVLRVARAAGHPLPAPAGGSLSRAGAPGSIGPVAGSVLAMGAVLIAATWASSLRARRPWRPGDDGAPAPDGT